MNQESKDVLLHILRNPDGWGEETVRDVRQQAAAELERLWRMEAHARMLNSQMRNVLAKEKQ